MTPLLSLLQSKLIPWAEDDLAQRLIVARPDMKKSDVPRGVGLSRRKIPGKRVIVRNRRDFGNKRLFLAEWREAGLHELEVPKLICVTSGITDFQAGEHIITCGEGHFILLPPRTPMTYLGRSHLEGERRKNGSCDLLQVLPVGDNIRCWPCHSRGEEHYDDPTTHCLIRHPQSAQLFKLFVEELLSNESEEDSLSIAGHLLSTVFGLLAREIRSGRSVGILANSPQDSEVSEPVQEIRDYIRNHLNQSLTIERVARHVYMSPAQFTRYIRRETGRTFVDMLTEYRIAEAKVLLEETDLSVTYISELVGFKSATYFNDLFRHTTGYTPGNFRKLQANKKFDWK